MEPFEETILSNGVKVLGIKPWMEQNPSISAGISSRLGGSSKQEMATLNCALHVKDDRHDVIHNRMKLAAGLGFSFEAWTCAEQVHHNKVRVITQENKGKGRELREDALQDTDGIITDEKGVLLTAFFADCVPLFFWDPKAKAIGLAHAGWKGTIQQIAKETLKSMISQFGCKPENIRAAIGPSIGPCCYEVDDFVMLKIQELLPGSQYGLMIDGVNDLGYYENKGNGKYLLDLKELNRQLMIKAGILATNIEITRWCTSCSNHLFYSHRKEHGKTGRMAAWIGLPQIKG